MEYLNPFGSTPSASASASSVPSFLSRAGGGGGGGTGARLFNQPQQDVVAATTHSQDNARLQQFHFGQLELIHDPGRRDIHWALDHNASTYSATVGGGAGLGPDTVDAENRLLRAPTENQRELPPRLHAERNVNQRLMLTVPYLGRGSVDPALEFRLQVGVIAPPAAEAPLRNPQLADAAASAQYDYDAFARDTILARANEPLPAPDQRGFGETAYYGPLPSLGGFAPRHTFEEQTNGLTAFGENTRITKYSSSASVAYRR